MIWNPPSPVHEIRITKWKRKEYIHSRNLREPAIAFGIRYFFAMYARFTFFFTDGACRTSSSKTIFPIGSSFTVKSTLRIRNRDSLVPLEVTLYAGLMVPCIGVLANIFASICDFLNFCPYSFYYYANGNSTSVLHETWRVSCFEFCSQPERHFGDLKSSLFHSHSRLKKRRPGKTKVRWIAT